MRELQGTWLGAVLDNDRLSFSGWTEASYTASTSQQSNLPVSFNDRANTFLLQQQWFRIDRALVTAGTSDPSFGYHLDVLVGSRTGFPGLYTAVTGGLQFRLRKGILIRPELRYDYNGQSRPFEGKHDQFLAASDLIVRW